ncbi:hypothetical protein SAMN05443634_10645 [Chishuiella changwenlii]|uniref:YD repeat-containing protein n=1 Tax=Chishuiella changwenlii TaxID=1434701 RepID=A0A1M6Y186_9FLAO|nr:hypothetical protein [Chishuiella changwenlii]GGE93853.1 hypothetical protein GCM10010984_09360 [Chishuiella changwenlii]SHL11990.1 hypothetical protein SAMN05443634_10645 [Chishuiella changwenlii]
MKKLLLFIPFLIFSCTDDDSNSNKENNLPTSIHVKYLFENNFYIIVPGENNQLKLSYKDGKLNRFEGGGFADPYSANYTFIFNKLTEFTYSSNNILRKSRNNLRNYEYPTQTNFIMNGNIVISSVEDSINNESGIKKYQKYTYHNNQLAKILTYNKYPEKQTYEKEGIERLFYFNSVGNLDSIVKQNVVVDNDLNTYEVSSRLKNKSVKILEDYDNSSNPFKQLFLLDEFFDRSLSKNNFTKVTIKEYVDNKLESTYYYKLDYHYINSKVDLKK